MLNVKIRQANVEDVEQLARLFDLYRQFYQKEPDELKRAEDFLRQRLTNNESVVFVADDKGVLVGFTQLYPCFSSLSMSRVWILNDLYVDAAHRGKKIGLALMNAAHDFARSSGATSIQLETRRTNTTAQSLYTSLGYEADKEFLVFSLSLQKTHERAETLAKA